MAWINNGDKTRGSSGSGLGLSSSDDFLPSEFNVYLYHGLATSGSNNSPEIRYDGVSADDYSWRKSGNGGNDGVVTADNNIQIDNHGGSTDKFGVVYAMNIASKEKLQISSLVDSGGAGAGNAPNRTYGVGKMNLDSETAQYTAIEFDSMSYTLNQHSNLSALGDRGTKTSDLANIQTNSIFETSDTGKHYIWGGSAWTEVA